MGAITYREGGAIPDKQLAKLAAALGVPAATIPRPVHLLAVAGVISAWDGARLVGLARLVGDLQTWRSASRSASTPPTGSTGSATRSWGARWRVAGPRRCWCCWRAPREAAFYAPFGFTEPVQAHLRPAPSVPGA